MARGRDTQIALALSGGGHRATLYSVGVCMALVDRGLNSRVIQISSVSGGSIFNAVLAQYEKCFAELTSDDFDKIAQDVASAIAYRPVLSGRWIAAYFGLMLVCGVALAWALSAVGLPDALLLVAIAAGAGVPLLWFGQFITWRFRRSYFPGYPARTFGDLSTGAVDHVFCASDLLTGFPVYVTTWDGGRVWRRTKDVGTLGGLSLTSGEVWDGARLTLAEVVRASAGFPGIPPRRIRVGGPKPDGSMATRVDRESTFGGAFPAEHDYDKGGVMLLSDGGVINNLGTQTLNEDKFFQGARRTRPDAALIAVNASARLRARQRWPYYVPGVSTIFQLWRCLELLHSNSVVPRVTSARTALRRRANAGTYDDPIDLVIELAEQTGLLESSLKVSIVEDPDVLRRRNPQYKRGQAEMLDAVRSFLHQHREDPASADERAQLVDQLERISRALPWEVPQVSGILDHREIEGLTGSPWWGSLTETEQDLPDVAVPTTLGRFPPDVVRALALRGYLHGYLASLAIEPCSTMELSPGSAASRATERILALAQPLPPSRAFT
jgi:Patatin-like phospholipase